MNAAHLHLLADFEDLVKVWAPIIFFVVYGVAQLVGSIQEEKRKAARKRPQPPAPELPRAPGAPAAPVAGDKPLTLEETLRREVDEFLRRAQGAPPQRKAPQQPKPKPAEAKPRRPLVTPANRPEAKPATAPAEQPRPAQAPPLSRPSIAERVQQDLHGTATLGQHAGTLGAQVAQADERMEQHLREKFAHQLGTFVHAEHGDARPAAGSPMAQELRKMLSSPAGVKQIIVASEILQRPTHRWR
jgi:hypothetical protein